MNSNNKLRNAIRLGLGIGVGTVTFGAAPGVMAQSAAEIPLEVEEIIVTGSRIKRADLDSASPVTVLNRTDLLASGVTDVGMLLKRMPSMSGFAIGTATNNGGNGSVEVNLRGMGVDRTLTLVNGLRVVDNGDYQTIPSNMVERVEILKDGASAIYGADAVAGVVNIITRKDYEGLSIDVQQNDFFDTNSAGQTTFGLIVGKNFDGGNLVFGAEYVDQEGAFQSDTPWQLLQGAYYLYPAGCENNVFAPYDGSGTSPPSGCYSGGSSRIPEGRLRFIDGQGTFINEGNGLVADDGRLYNYGPVNYIQTPYKRINVFGEGIFDINDSTRFVGSIRGALRESAQQLAPLPYDNRPGFDPSYSGVFNGAPYNGISEDNFYLIQAANAAGLTPAPVDQVRRRMVETNRRFEQDINQFQANLGLQGTFNNIDWDVSYSRGHRTRNDIDFGQFNGALLANAMGPSADLDGDGSPECYGDVTDDATLIAGCVPFNFFGGPFSVTEDMINYVSADLNDTRITDLEEAGFGFSGSAFDLPGGELGWAAGLGYRAQKFNYNADSNKATNAVTGSVGESTVGSIYTVGYFAEFLAPVFENGAQALDIKGGIRYDEYNLFDGEVTWQLGVEFQAYDGLKLRTTAGTVFRAPTLEDLFDGLADSAPQYTDPCIPDPGDALPPGCAQIGEQTDSQLPARVGGNPLLKPETGETLTVGAVWTPGGFAEGLTMTVDYWKIDLEDGISSLGAQYILEDCYVRQVSSSCDLVTRTPSYNISELLDRPLNVAQQGASGVDTELRYTFDTAAGQFDTAFLWAYLIERTRRQSDEAGQEGLGGRFTDDTVEDGGGYPRNKINYSIHWNRDNLMIGYLGEYIHDLLSDESPAIPTGLNYVYNVDAVLYHDLVASYTFNQGTSISAGITNLSDEEPPFIAPGFNGATSPEMYRMLGRGWYARLSHEFE
jgi:outer membrane receptor protein involved in Fe transport